MREAFAVQKLLTFFNKKYWHILEINFRKFNETLANDIATFEQPGPDIDTFIVPSHLNLDFQLLSMQTVERIHLGNYHCQVWPVFHILDRGPSQLSTECLLRTDMVRKY